jgi:sarcosine oxidase, subunit beta
MKAMKTFDVIIIGAGSVGTPLAWKLAAEKLKVLVLDRRPSAGQGQNKAAIGGVRATHSDAAKISVCQQSLAIFSTWQERYGDDIGWIKGGYSFPAYTEAIEQTLKKLLVLQKNYKLTIDWYPAQDLLKIIPGLNPTDLRGGTYSPDDGVLSPFLAVLAFQKRARHEGAVFHYNEEVTGITLKKGTTKEVRTPRGSYQCETLVIAAGAEAHETGKLIGMDLPVIPDSHEGGITEPVERFFSPLVVDLRERPLSKNFYFYQNEHGQVVFCVTPSPLIEGTNRHSTSLFIPQVAKRLIEVMPRLKNLKLRRVWRGLYPMTPDGVPIVDEVKEKKGVYVSVGMCGQGLMLGPGLAENLTSLILHRKPVIAPEIFSAFSQCRDFACVEMLK